MVHATRVQLSTRGVGRWSSAMEASRCVRAAHICSASLSVRVCLWLLLTTPGLGNKADHEKLMANSSTAKKVRVGVHNKLSEDILVFDHTHDHGEYTEKDLAPRPELMRQRLPGTL